MLEIALQGDKLEKVCETRFLGCILDDKLEASRHIEEMSKKLNRAIFVLKNLCRATGYRMAKPLYEAYIHSHFNYCSGFWGMAAKSKLNRLYRTQKRALKVISPAGCRDLPPEGTNILPLPRALTYSICTFLHQQISKQSTECLSLELLGSRKDTRSKNSRIIRIERRSTLIGNRSYLVKAAKVWNSLPLEIRTTDSIPLFKIRLKKLLLESPDERLNFF